jgi:hypothetical protein
MERETGIGPATNSLEGCDSTTELLPRSRPPLLSSGAVKPSLLNHSNQNFTCFRFQILQILELMIGIEPTTSPLPRECSTD